MKNVKKSPAEFLGAKVLSPMDQDKLKGGFVTRTGGQQQVTQQQQHQQVAV